MPVDSFRIRMAGLVFEVRHRFDYTRRQCADYIVPRDFPADLIMETTPERFERIRAQWERHLPPDVTPETLCGQVEFACIPVSAYAQLPLHGALWLHATVVGYRGRAYAFTAVSGYGKTTHARLWREAFGDEAQIINGDMPLLHVQEGVFHACGTPFCGKERYQVNTSLPLAGICYLTHSDRNHIRRMDPALAMAQLFHDNPMNAQHPQAHLDMYTHLVEQVPVYQLYCDMTPEAARVALAGMQA